MEILGYVLLGIVILAVVAAIVIFIASLMDGF